MRSGRGVAVRIVASLVEQVGGEFSVTCPTGIPPQEGTTFTCSVTDESDGSAVWATAS